MGRKVYISKSNLKRFWKDLVDNIQTNFFKKEDSKTLVEYDSLTPTILSEKDFIRYDEALSESLRKDDITNIALTGVYGSGKSSVLKTFQEKNKAFEYLNISLAAFKPDKKPDQSEIEDLERLLELSILQQLFYHVKHTSIPDSRFRRIKSLSKNKIAFISTGFLVWLCSYFIFFDKPPINDLFPSEWNSILLKYLAGVILLTGIGILLSKLIRIFNNSKINKLNVQSGDFELDENVDQSIINKNVDEIIYFFEKTKYNVIIIEDLDRFDNTEIFSKLREINLLLNHSEQVNKKIVFIYALKDDLFEDYLHRTKFFDFIIPIIPIVNPSNSSEKLLEKFKAIKSKNKPTEEFIEEVSIFIKDMRLLKNIWNEYLIYSNILSNSLTQNNLLAIVIYKNLHPKDFSKLNDNEGKLYNVISSRNQFVLKREEELDDLIDVEKREIKKLEKEQIKSEKELRAIYANKIFEKLPDAVIIEIGNNFYRASDLLSEKVFEKVVEESRFTYYTFDNFKNPRQNNSYKRQRISSFGFDEVEKEVNSESTYQERINNIHSEVVEVHSKEIERLNNEKDNVRQLTLNNIIKQSKSRDIFGELQDDKLVVFLLSEGYINERFSDYISYFHGVSLTRNDWEFMQSLISSTPLDWNFELFNHSKLLKKAKLRYFNSDAILNFSLLDYILKFNYSYSKQVNITLSQIINTSNIDFIEGYLKIGKKVSKLFNLLPKKWIGLWNFIETKSKFTSEKKDKYLMLILNNADTKDVWIQSNESNLKKYISENKKFLKLLTPKSNTEKIKEAIEKLNIEFYSLTESTKESKEVFDFIVEKGFYKITSQNIALILESKSINKISKTILANPNYTSIQVSEFKPLKDKIDENIDIFISNVALEQYAPIESEECLISLLNHNTLSVDLKEEMLYKNGIKIQSMSNIEKKEDKELVLETKSILNEWDNLFNYYKSSKTEEIDEALSKYLNDKDLIAELSSSRLKKSDTYSDDFIRDFSKKLVLNDKISDESFKLLIKSIPYTYNTLEFDNLSVKKIEYMISSKFLNFTIDNYNLLRGTFPNNHINLIVIHFEKFLEKLNEITFTSNDLLLLLKSEESDTEMSIAIIDNIDEAKILAEPETCKILCDNYSKATIKVDISFDLLKALIKNGNNEKSKIVVFNKHISDLTRDEVILILGGTLTRPYSQFMKSLRKTNIPKTYYNLELINYLKNNNFISTYSEKKSSYRVNSKR